jgi:hypothetical protein
VFLQASEGHSQVSANKRREPGAPSELCQPTVRQADDPHPRRLQIRGRFPKDPRFAIYNHL